MEIDKPITIAIILFITLVLSFYLVLPKYYAFQDSLARIGEKEKEYRARNAYYIEVTSAYKELMVYQDILKKIETALPNKFSPSSLINFINQKVIENGMALGKITTGNPAESSVKPGMFETNISVNVVGSYVSLEKFIASLEKSTRIIDNQSFVFSISPPSIDNPVVSETYPMTLENKGLFLLNMAIVFISPGGRQKVFILAIAGFFSVLVIIITLVVLLAKPKLPPIEESFVPAQFAIKFGVLKSPQVAMLDNFPELEKQFSYVAQSSDGKSKEGVITAPSPDRAKEMLESLNYKFVSVEELVQGRDNPFLPYYTIKPLPPVKKTK